MDFLEQLVLFYFQAILHAHYRLCRPDVKHCRLGYLVAVSSTQAVLLSLPRCRRCSKQHLPGLRLTQMAIRVRVSHVHVCSLYYVMIVKNPSLLEYTLHQLIKG